MGLPGPETRAWGGSGVHNDSSRSGGPGRGPDTEWSKAASGLLGQCLSGALAQEVTEKELADETFPRS